MGSPSHFTTAIPPEVVPVAVDVLPPELDEDDEAVAVAVAEPLPLAVAKAPAEDHVQPAIA